MKYKTYKQICDKHKINPHQIMADKNIQEILNDDKDKDLEFYENYLDEYFKVYYFKGKVA
tara:strand:- start:1486 stop:1665 length:180 start_codon:yes stop_codon:yes gene_type:complete